MGRAGGRAARGVLAVIAAAVVGVVLFLLLRTDDADEAGPRGAERPETAQGAPRGGRVTPPDAPPVVVAEPIRLEVSGPDGRPVAGAVAHRVARLPDDRRTPWDSLAHGAAASGTTPLATTDAAGRAEIAVDGDTPVPLRVSATGYEPALVSAMRGTNVVRLSRGFRVSGRVIDDSGAAVGGAVVAVVSMQRGLDDVADGRARFTRCGSDGRFEADAVARGDYILFAGREPALAGQAASVRVVADVELTLVLPAAEFSLRGRVVNADDDAPVAGARVEAQLVGPRGSLMRSAVTGADGAFVLDRLEASFVHRVRVRADGCAEFERRWGAGPGETPPRTGDGSDLTLRVRRAASLRGQVTMNGVPAPGAEVSVWKRLTDAGRWVRNVATTNAEGRYEFTGLEPALCVVDVHAPGHARMDAPPREFRNASNIDRTWGRSVVALSPGPAVVHDVELVPVLRCKLSVASAEGRPVAGATIEQSDGFASSFGPWRTNSAGEAVVDLRDGAPLTIRVQAAGFVTASAELPAAERHSVVLQPAWTVTGRVEVNGRPGSRAAVRVLPAYAASYEAAARWTIGGPAVYETVADADGRFEIRGVPLAAFVVAAMGDEGIAGFSDVVRPSVGAAPADVVVRVASARVRGVVLDPRGQHGGVAIRLLERQPTTGVRWVGGIWVERRPGGSGVPVVAWSGADGTFEIAVPAGVEHSVWADDGVTRSAPVPISAIAAGEARDVVLHLAAETGIHGVVLTADGVAAPGVLVRLARLPTSTEDAAAQHSTRTGPDGTFRFPGVQGEWYLRVVQDGGELFGWTIKVTGPSDAPVRVQIPRRREARGVVFDGDGVPCRAADIVVTDARGGILTNATTGPDGTFVVSIPDGEDVIVRAGVGVLRTELTVAAASSGSNRLELRLPRARPMRVRVVDAAGAALVGVSITYLPPQPHGGFALGSVVTGPDGRAETVPLPAGAYDFKRSLHTADRPDPQRTTVRWDLSAGEVEVRLTD